MNLYILKILILIFFLIFSVTIGIWINHLKQINLQYSVREDNNCEGGVCLPPDEWNGNEN